MKKFPTITTSFAVILSMIMAALPLSVKAADDYSLNNTAVQVRVSEKNGGFSIRTAEGDKINKDDNNKNLLFPLDDDNTSFASVRITRGGESKDYVFGGRYKDSSPVAVSNTGSQIDAVWSVDGVTVTQTIQLANSGDNQHGMAHISYTVRNSGAPAEIQLRLLMDTALGLSLIHILNTFILT